MAPQDLWYLKTRGPDGDRLKSKRHGRGRRWRVNYVDPVTGEERTEHFDKKTGPGSAEEFENAIKADISRGQFIDPKAGQVKVKAYAEEWFSTKVFDEATAERVERTLRLHVYPVLGHRNLGPLVRSHIQHWVADRSRHLSPSTLSVAYHTVLLPLMAAAVADKKIPATPCVDIDLPKVVGRDYYVATPPQVFELSEALPAEYRAAPFLAAGCGLRESEILGLEQEHVVFLRRELRAVQQLKYVSGRKPFLALPKNGMTATLDLPTSAADAVSAQIKARPPVVVELEDETDYRKVRIDRATGERTVPRREAHLLFTVNGRAMYRADWSKVWRPAVAKVGLPEGFRLHDLRHLFATTLIHHGASVKTVQLAMRHANAKTTFETYIHEWPDLLDRPRNIMDRVLTQELSTVDQAEAQEGS